MASAVRGVWAIDIGTNSLKALRLTNEEDGFEVIGFDYIEHSKILSGSNIDELEKEQIISKSLHTFVERNELDKDEVAISVAGHLSFARFIKLPPVKKEKIPEVVQFEAVQQIPFDINEVEWDWQLMSDPDSSEVEVGLFAIKNELLTSILGVFSKNDIQVSNVQIAPIALSFLKKKMTAFWMSLLSK
jgi:type IV pilus assembly protein PilM